MSVDDARPDSPRTESAAQRPLHHITRRSFLGWAGAATAASAYILEMPHPVRMALAAAGHPDPWIPPSAGPVTLTTQLRRPDDFIALRFEFYNLKLDTSDKPHPKL